MHQPLDAIQRRVLGVLIEKSLAQPSYYPMTLSAVLSAVNQKSNRDPVMSLDEDGVWNALDTLRQRGLVAKLLPGMSGRVERFKHEAKTCFGWEKPQRAVMAELLLRGPQTVGELRSRGSRMYPFENTDAIAAVIEGLSRADPPMVAALPRSASRSATRYTHLLAPENQRPAVADTQPAPNANDSVTEADEPAAVADRPLGTEHYRRQLEEVQLELAQLRDAVTDLRRRLDSIEEQQG